MVKRHVRARVYDSRYETRGRIGDPCTYCGVESSGYDHIPPLCHLEYLPDEHIDQLNCRKVPACKECNSFLGDKLLDSIVRRREEVRDHLRKKYARYLRIPRWDEDELTDLEPSFADFIRRSSNYAEWIKQRITWRR